MVINEIKLSKHVLPDHMVGKTVGPGVKSSTIRTNSLHFNRSTDVRNVPVQGKLILVVLAAF